MNVVNYTTHCKTDKVFITKKLTQRDKNMISDHDTNINFLFHYDIINLTVLEVIVIITSLIKQTYKKINLLIRWTDWGCINTILQYWHLFPTDHRDTLGHIRQHGYIH